MYTNNLMYYLVLILHIKDRKFVTIKEEAHKKLKTGKRLTLRANDKNFHCFQARKISIF